MTVIENVLTLSPVGSPGGPKLSLWRWFFCVEFLGWKLMGMYRYPMVLCCGMIASCSAQAVISPYRVVSLDGYIVINSSSSDNNNNNKS